MKDDKNSRNNFNPYDLGAVAKASKEIRGAASQQRSANREPYALSQERPKGTNPQGRKGG